MNEENKDHDHAHDHEGHDHGHTDGAKGGVCTTCGHEHKADGTCDCGCGRE